MKKQLNLCLAALMLAAFCLPALAQEETAEHSQGYLSSDNPEGQTASEDAPASKKSQANKTEAAKSAAAKKAKADAAAKKKKAKKKKPAKPVSEYKFSSGESVPAYKFDKRANPIVKAPKKKKPAKKAAAKGEKSEGKPAAKLKTSKPIGEEEPAQDAPADQAAGE